MTSQHLIKVVFLSMMMSAAIFLTGCGDDNEIPLGGDAGDLQQVTVVILKNNTDERVAGAHIVFDGNNNLSCDTPGPGGDAGGECTFMLTKTEHSVTVSKVGYSTRTLTFQVTGSMTFKYISIFDF